MDAVLSATALQSDLLETIRLLPGYDPYAQAGDCWFDADAAQHRIDFIEQCCTLTQGKQAGDPFILQPWEKAIVANLYGWKRPNGYRRYRTALVFVPCGNGKSEFGAALINTALFVPDDQDEPGGHVFSAAGKKDQTRYVWDPVCAMIRACPAMDERAEIWRNSLVVASDEGIRRTYWPMARETHTGTEHGGHTHFAVADELHAHLDGRLITAVKRGMVKRRQPLLVCLTTSDYEREGSPCNEMHDYASKVRDGLIEDPTFLPAIYEAAKDDDWTDPEVWRAANPNWGISVDPENYAGLCNEAKNNPAYENEFKRLHLNIRTEQSVRILPVHVWDACKGELPDLTKQDCWTAIDLGGTQDLTAFAAAFQLPESRYGLKFQVWVPEEAVRRREQHGDPTYAVWVRQGHMKQTPGAEVDYDTVRADVNAFHDKYPIQELAADRLFQGAQLVQQFSEQDGLTAFPHGQGFIGMAAPMKTFLELVNTGRVVHDGNPVIRWMVSNLAAVQDSAGNWKPDKKRSGDKIDGVVAAVMALGRAAREHGPERSFYEDHPVRSL